MIGAPLPSSLRQTSFAARVIDLTPGQAVTAFDGWLAAGPLGCLDVDAGSLRSSAVGPWREVDGVLRTARGRAIARVALELRPWSPMRSELGLRLLQVPRATRASYFKAAHDALDQVVAGLRAREAQAA